MKKPYQQTIKTLKAIVLLFIGINLFSCSKKSDFIKTLPPATQNGSNTMGAYINNVIWNPAHTAYGTGITASITAYTTGASFSIVGVRDNATVSDGTTTVAIQIGDFNGTGSYSLYNNSPISGSNINNIGAVSTGSDTRTYYLTDSLHQGNITVTYYDTVKKIISGTFQFDAVNRNNSLDVVHVTSGRFDFTYPVQTNNTFGE